LSKLLIEGPDPDKDGISVYTLEDLVAVAESTVQMRFAQIAVFCLQRHIPPPPLWAAWKSDGW
jgi:hypothetical protein